MVKVSKQLLSIRMIKTAKVNEDNLQRKLRDTTTVNFKNQFRSQVDSQGTGQGLKVLKSDLIYGLELSGISIALKPKKNKTQFNLLFD